MYVTKKLDFIEQDKSFGSVGWFKLVWVFKFVGYLNGRIDGWLKFNVHEKCLLARGGEWTLDGWYL